MRKTILFDLDGTLLPLDTDRFVYLYFKELAGHLGHLIPPARLAEQIMSSTMKMIQNTDSELTNAEVFAADFFPKIGRPEAELMPSFETFYRERFPGLRSAFTGLPGLAPLVVKKALDLGYEIVLATNPLFPRIAIEERMRWVAVDSAPWRLVTTYEEMHACKPQPAYYKEVLERIDQAPSACLMVGNDIDEDGAAAAAGIPVYFVTDFLINRSGRTLPPDSFGSLADFLIYLESRSPGEMLEGHG